MPAPFVYLASRSPRRQELLRQIGVEFETVRVEVEEAVLADETPQNMVCRLALAKARAGLAALGGQARGPVLGSDTAVVLDEEIFGKPANRAQGLAMLARLSGRCHRVMSAIALVGPGLEEVRLNITEVCFRETTDQERQACWDSGEPTDKAGAYGIQGLAAIFVKNINGSYSGVMGLPLYETAELLAQAGMGVLALRSTGE